MSSPIWLPRGTIHWTDPTFPPKTRSQIHTHTQTHAHTHTHTHTHTYICIHTHTCTHMPLFHSSPRFKDKERELFILLHHVNPQWPTAAMFVTDQSAIYELLISDKCIYWFDCLTNKITVVGPQATHSTAYTGRAGRGHLSDVIKISRDAFWSPWRQRLVQPMGDGRRRLEFINSRFYVLIGLW